MCRYNWEHLKIWANKFGPNKPVLQKNEFGSTVTGRVASSTRNGQVDCNLSAMVDFEKQFHSLRFNVTYSFKFIQFRISYNYRISSDNYTVAYQMFLENTPLTERL